MVEEQVSLVDETGTVIGTAPRSVMRRDNLLHAATAVVVRSSAGDIYLSRRTSTKDWAPGHWDAGAGGVITFGEDPYVSAQRELSEELGITGVELRPLMTNLYADDTTRCFEHVFEATWDGPVVHQVDEVAEGRWASLDELARLLLDPTQPFVPDGRMLLERAAAEGRGDYAQLRAFAGALTAGVDFTVTRHGQVRSLAEAAALRGIEPRDLVKTMIIRVSADDHRIVLVPGDAEIAWPKVRSLLGVNRLSMPDADTARTVTGYPRGTITPFGACTRLPVLADASISGTISLGAGAYGVGMTVAAEPVLTALDAQVADLVNRPPA
jgi:prolyl-tRNA editing enzyme YbaK/EbsC (Cys-tRNA(Pro) deacylase)/isopentenyldiphosphate isomerase